MKSLLTFILFTLLSGICLAEQKNINIAADPWCPFNCEPKSDTPGIMVELAREALAMSGYTLDYSIMNWARAKKMVQVGQLDGIVGMVDAETPRQRYHIPATPLATSTICFFTLANSNWRFKDVSSLEGQSLGWINDYWFSDKKVDKWVEENLPKGNVVPVFGEDETLERLIGLLMSRRVTAFADDRLVVAYTLKQKELDGVVKEAGCMEVNQPLHIAFSRQLSESPGRVQALENGLKALFKDKAKVSSILEKYGVTIDKLGLDL